MDQVRAIFASVLKWVPLPSLPGIGSPSYSPSTEPTLTELMEGWEYLLSEAELQLQKMQNNTIQNELNSLRKMSANVRFRPLIIQRVSSLSNSWNLPVNTEIDNDKRHSLIKTVINSVAGSWFTTIEQLIRLEGCVLLVKADKNGVNVSQLTDTRISNLQSAWNQEKYQHNLVGDLISFAFQASSGSRITTKLVSDLIWTTYLALSRFLINILDRQLHEMEIYILIDMAFDVSDPDFGMASLAEYYWQHKGQRR